MVFLKSSLFFFVCACALANGGGGGGGFPNSPFGHGGGGGGSSTDGFHACVPSHANCNLQCPNGYMKGPMNCDFCSCAANQNNGGVTSQAPTTHAPITNAITSSPAGVGTTTRDPCILAKTLCSSRCGDGGYLADPSDCTFCVCKSDIQGSG